MKRILVGLSLPPLLLLAPGCEPKEAAPLPDRPVEGWHTAWAFSDCAPWDGAATTIFFADSLNLPQRQASYPHLWVSLYRPAQVLAGEAFTWDADEKDIGGAMWCSGPTNLACEASTSARVTIGRMDLSGDGSITGTVDLVFPNRTPVIGTFSATWLEHQPICG